MKGSVIIPSFGRRFSVLQESLRSLFKNMVNIEADDEIVEIFLIDQNPKIMDLFQDGFTFPERISYKAFHSYQLKERLAKEEEKKIIFYHIHHPYPSVTVAKNLAGNMAQGEILFFFDDDVTLHPNTLKCHFNYHKKEKSLGMLGGQEVVASAIDEKKKLKSLIRKGIAFFLKFNNEESKYLTPNGFIGRITNHSFFLCDYSLPVKDLIEVDTVRGHQGSVKMDAFLKVEGFDENFQGTALREESDFCLRLQYAGFTNYYFSESPSLHRRQLGGCNNLSKQCKSLLSKLECESYFQKKHFSHIPTIFFLLRTLPYIWEYFQDTWGGSFFLVLKNCWEFQKTKGQVKAKDYRWIYN